jgi:hypothetical protein
LHVQIQAQIPARQPFEGAAGRPARAVWGGFAPPLSGKRADFQVLFSYMGVKAVS